MLRVGLVSHSMAEDGCGGAARPQVLIKLKMNLALTTLLYIGFEGANLTRRRWFTTFRLYHSTTTWPPTLLFQLGFTL